MIGGPVLMVLPVEQLIELDQADQSEPPEHLRQWRLCLLVLAQATDEGLSGQAQP